MGTDDDLEEFHLLKGVRFGGAAYLHRNQLRETNDTKNHWPTKPTS
jgi:hypothetical protein